MADGFTYKFDGLDEYLKRVLKLNKNLQKEAIGLIQSATSLTARDARKNAPKDTGFLIRSIQWRLEKDGTVGIVFVFAEYGQWVEFGTKNPKRPPRPFLGPAFEKNKARLESELKRITKRV